MIKEYLQCDLCKQPITDFHEGAALVIELGVEGHVVNLFQRTLKKTQARDFHIHKSCFDKIKKWELVDEREDEK